MSDAPQLDPAEVAALVAGANERRLQPARRDDPEEIRGRRDRLVREREKARVVGADRENKQMTGILSRLPHDDYIDAVHAALTGLGIEPDRYWTETPDGEQLDAVLTFDTDPDIRAEWPDGVFLGWDQRAGWSLVDESTNRTLFPLGLGTYAAPQAVAVRTKTILFSAGSTPVGETWDGAAALEEAVKAWGATP